MAQAKFTYLRSLLPLLGLGQVFLLSGQSIVQSDVLPEVGSSWHMRALQSVPVDELPIGPLVWSYGDLVANDLFGATYTIMAPQEVQGSSVYTGTDRVVRRVLDNAPEPYYTFYDVQSDRTLVLGTMGPIINTFYRPGTMAFAYPLELNGSKQDEFCYVSQSVGTDVNYCGTTQITLSASGTLELPFESYADVQLVITRQAIALQGTIDSTIVTTKEWYAEGIPFPLVHIARITNSDGSTTSSGQLVDPNSLVGIAEPLRMERLVAFPNPTTGTVSFPAIEGGQLEVYSSDGRSVRSQRIAANERFVLDLGEMPNGVYHVALRDHDVQRSTMLVVAR